MWHLLLILLVPTTSLLAPNVAAAVETSNGPVSSQEAKILWADGKKAFDDGKLQDAVNNLQRLVDRYPGYSGYQEAHRLLGRSLMLLGRPKEALAPLKSYISATGNRELGLRTRLWLGDDYLALSMPNEAYLASLEVEKAAKNTHPRLFAESQFLKARALIALNQDARAQRVIDSVESSPAVQSDTELKGLAAHARITLKLRACAKYPSAGPMDEAQARDQFSRRALCLQEALVLFKTAAESKELGTGEEASTEIYQGFAGYTRAAAQPPPPPRLKPADRTAKQKKQYLAELSARLDQDRKSALRESLGTLANWTKNASPQAAAAFKNLSKKIEQLI